ncbi:MAG: tRNA glutamyl-Q(34) synthetase GluQRS, partial [Myxococcales bacterium]|nr:tRNA glutamyl-Q(34) synthetase GluQRS [Myxococcales bacterium]
SYQLAVVVDDGEQGITEVVRGADLLPSTPRQIALHRALGGQEPSFAHVPMIHGTDGTPLSKRNGALSIASLREEGSPPEKVIGTAARLLGQSVPDGMPPDLLSAFFP